MMKNTTNPYTDVSVIIPTYNGEKYIAEAIESILNQSFPDFELIIIDDASKDNTWGIVKRYAKMDARIRPFKNETNLGFAENRNKAIRLAHGEYIVWQDQDDVSFPTRISIQLALMKSNKEIGAVGGFMEIFDEKRNYGIRTYPEGDRELRKMIFKFSPVALPASMIRKDALLLVGGYDTQFSPAGDLDMSFKIGTSYKLANVPELVIRYRMHQNSATFQNLRRIELDTIRIRLKYANNPHYKPKLLDYLYNVVHYVSAWIIPPRLKIGLFNLLRTKSSKK